MTRELPMLATDRVALAVREGRKTQHRVPVKPRKGFSDLRFNAAMEWAARNGRTGVALRGPCDGQSVIATAPWQPGDRLYCREAHAYVDRIADGYDRDDPTVVQYRADLDVIRFDCHPPYRPTDRYAWPNPPRWRPSIHMPRWASRTITGPLLRVWPERVQDISCGGYLIQSDVAAEGCPVELQTGAQGIPNDMGASEIAWWRDLWISLYGAESWERNDWVWACEWRADEVAR